MLDGLIYLQAVPGSAGNLAAPGFSCLPFGGRWRPSSASLYVSLQLDISYLRSAWAIGKRDRAIWWLLLRAAAGATPVGDLRQILHLIDSRQGAPLAHHSLDKDCTGAPGHFGA